LSRPYENVQNTVVLPSETTYIKPPEVGGEDKREMIIARTPSRVQINLDEAFYWKGLEFALLMDRSTVW